jgi:hypothetical protein
MARRIELGREREQGSVVVPRIIAAPYSSSPRSLEAGPRSQQSSAADISSTNVVTELGSCSSRNRPSEPSPSHRLRASRATSQLSPTSQWTTRSVVRAQAPSLRRSTSAAPPPMLPSASSSLGWGSSRAAGRPPSPILASTLPTLDHPTRA